MLCIMLCIKSPELIHLLNGSLCPLNHISSIPPSPPAPGNHHSFYSVSASLAFLDST